MSLLMDWCRLCAREGVDIEQPESPDCYRRVTKYLSIQVQKGNNLPCSICKNCRDVLYDFDNYALQCQKVQYMFHNLLMQNHDDLETVRAFKNNFLSDGNLLSPYNIKKEDIANESGNCSGKNTPTKKITNNRNESKNLLKEENETIDDDSLNAKDEVYFDDYFSDSEEDYLPLSSITEKDSTKNPERKEKKVSKAILKPKRKKKYKSKEKLSVLEKLINESISVKEENISDEENVNQRTNEITLESKEPKKPRKKEIYDSFFSYECYVCKQDLKNWNALCVHFRDVHDSRAKIKCCCGKLLASRVSIARHYANHGKTKSFNCSKCDKRFPRQSELDSHKISHLPRDQYPFVCCKCARRFTSQQLLKHHEKKHIPVEERLIHLCEVCKSKFASKSSLLAHMRAVHQRLKPFICDQCGRAFTTKGILEEHQVRHSDARPHVCNVCQKSFKTKQRLTIHLDTHNDTVYKCPHCPVFLNSRRTLRMHLFVHDSVARYQCSFCDKAFKRAKDLKNHINLHTGRRPYSCPWCSRTFANGSNCRAHKRRMHPHELRISDAKVAMINKVSPETESNVEKIESENTERKIIYSNIKRKSTTTSPLTKMPNFIFSPDASKKEVKITTQNKDTDITITVTLPSSKIEMVTPTKQEKSSPTHIYESSLSPLNLNTSGVAIKCDEGKHENATLIVSPVTQNDCNLSNLICNQNNSNNFNSEQNSTNQTKNSPYFCVKDIEFPKANHLYSNYGNQVSNAFILPDITVPSSFTNDNPYNGNN